MLTECDNQNSKLFSGAITWYHHHPRAPRPTPIDNGRRLPSTSIVLPSHDMKPKDSHPTTLLLQYHPHGSNHSWLGSDQRRILASPLWDQENIWTPSSQSVIPSGLCRLLFPIYLVEEDRRTKGAFVVQTERIDSVLGGVWWSFWTSELVMWASEIVDKILLGHQNSGFAESASV